MRGIVCLMTMLSAVGVCAEENWPQFRGPAGNGHSTSPSVAVTWSEAKNVTWKTPIHGRGWSSPVIWGDQIWMGTATDDGKEMSALCVDRNTGEVLRDVVLFRNPEPRFCHALNSYASPTPVIEAGRVYLHFGSYGTACLDTATGETLWERRDLPCNHWRGPGSSPIILDDKLIMHFDGYDFQYLVALDKRTGKTLWKKDREIDYGTDDGDQMKAYCTPIVIEVDGKQQLISPAAKAAIAYDPDNGDEIWRVRFAQHSATARPLFGHGLVFINTGFGKAQLHAVKPTGRGDVTDSHVVWRVTKSVPSMPSQLLIGELIYMIHDGVATCLEAKTGEKVWQKRLSGKYSASPIFAGGHIYFLSQQGKTTVIKPGRTYQEVAVNELKDGFMASPAASGKALFLRTKTHLYRIEQ